MDEVVQEATASDKEEVASESYKQAVLDPETTRVTTHKGLIVIYRAPVLRDGKRGVEEKAPIHIADIVRLLGMSISSTTTGPGQQDLIRGILKQGHSATKESAKAKKLPDERL